MEIQPRRWLGNAKTTAQQVRLIKSLDRSALPSHSPPAIIVHPGPDLDGDVTNPAGGNWRPFELNPVVNYGHAVPIGRGSVVMKSITYAGQRVDVPTGTSTFFQKSSDLAGLSLNKYDGNGNVVGKWDPDLCLHFAEEIGPKVLAGLVNSVSVEMFVQRNFCKSLGKRPGNARESYQVDQWDGLGYAHTLVPVHLSARMWDESEAERVEKAIQWREKVPARTGFGYICKSLDTYISAALADKPKKTVVAVRGTPPASRTAPSTNGVHRKKAFPPAKEKPDEEDDTVGNANAPIAAPGKKPMPKVAPVQAAPPVEEEDEYGLGTDANDPADAAQQALDDGTEPIPVGIGATFDYVQAISDDTAAYIDAMKASDNPKLIAKAHHWAGKMMKYAAKIQKCADQEGARIKSSAGMMQDEDPEGDDLEDDELDDDSELDDDDAEDGTETDPTAAEDVVAEVADKKKKKPDTDDDGNVVSKSFTGYVPSGRTYKTKSVKIVRHAKSDFGEPVGSKAKTQVPLPPVKIEATEDSHTVELAELRKRIEALTNNRR